MMASLLRLTLASITAALVLMHQPSMINSQTPAATDIFAFVGDQVRAALTSQQADQLSAYKSDPSSADVTVIRMPTDAMRSADAINLDFSAVRSVALDVVSVEERAPEGYTLFGRSLDGEDEATLVVEGDTVVGTIRSGGELYQVRPLGGGVQALIRVDRGAFPPDHPPEFEELEQERQDQFRPDAMQRQSFRDSCAEYTAVVAYTPAAKSQAGNIDALIQLAIDETNQGYQNSAVNTRLKLAHKYQTNYTESNDMVVDRDRLRIDNDNFMDEIHGLRDQHAADVALLITKSGNFCGIAADIRASADTAFAVVGQNCATGYYSFAHAIGHLQGARHNPEADPTTTPFAYGHGFFHQPDQWRTIMSYDCPGSCNRLDYWSKSINKL